MEFFGQGRILKELDYLLPDVNEGLNINLLLRAPSGYGKTFLGLMILNYFGFDNCWMYIPDQDGKLNYNFRDDKRFHFIDEVHELKIPEILYPLMDSGKYTFVFASNESGDLKEPLKNRCIPLIFEKYSENEMEEIVNRNLQLPLNKDMLNFIAKRCRGTPRVAKIICTRLNSIFKNYKVPENVAELDEILTEILNIKEGGLDQNDLVYLNYLEQIGGRASLATLMSGTRIDRTTILTEIEPLLLYLNKIKISHKGRELI